MALTAVPLAVIGYYDWKIAATTMTVVVVMGALRRIFRMIIAQENRCAAADFE
jgi:ABC-type bacteriocin/lantibiotic exporter with double-glycine peptidase domain